MSGRDVETEVYERLYGLSRRDRHGEGTVRERVLIDDGDVPAPGGKDVAQRTPPAIRRARRGPGRAALGRQAATLAARGIERLAHATRSSEGLVVAGAARGREAFRRARPAMAATRERIGQGIRDVRPPVERSTAVLPYRRVVVSAVLLRRRMVASAVLVVALIAVPLLALLLSSGQATRTGHPGVAASLPRSAPAWHPDATPRPRHHSAPPHASPEAGSATPSATQETRVQRNRRPKRLSHRSLRRRPTRTHTSPPRPDPIRRPIPHTRPLPPTGAQPPAPTTPTPTGTGGTAAGGSSDQPDAPG
jgi:hypothetical protein